MGGPDSMSVSTDVLQTFDLVVDGRPCRRGRAMGVEAVKPGLVRSSGVKGLCGLRQGDIKVFVEELGRGGIEDGMVCCSGYL